MDYEIIAYGNSDPTRATSRSGSLREGKPVLSPSEIELLNPQTYDAVLIASDFGMAMDAYDTLIQYRIPKEKILFLYRFEPLVGHKTWKSICTEDGTISSIIDDSVQILERNHGDSMTLWGLLTWNEHTISIPEDCVVIDIGMNTAMVSLLLAADSRVKKVYGFEPFQDTYKDALDNIANNNEVIRAKIYPRCAALADTEEIREVVVPNDMLSGLRSINSNISSNSGEKDKTFNVQVLPAGKCVEAIVNENKDAAIFLKIDVEGSEFQILNDLGKNGILERINCISMEYHRYPGELILLLEYFHFDYAVNGHGSQGQIKAFHR